MIFRCRRLNNVSEDVALVVLAALLVTAGVALSALTSGMLTRVLLEAVKVDQATLSGQVLKTQQALVDAIEDRLKSIEIPPTLTVTKKQTTHSLSAAFKDGSGVVFEPNSKVLGLTWTSDRRDIAKVDNDGIVTWVQTGTANITASYKTLKSGNCVVSCIEA